MGCGIDKSQLQRGTCEVLLGEADIESALVPLEEAGFTVLPTNQDLVAAEVRLLTMTVGRETKLVNALRSVRENYDVILIDCPPSLNMLTVNALVAADSVLIPMQCEYYALEGLSALLSTIEQIKAAVNPALELEGLLRTMFDPRNNLANEVSAQLIMHFRDKVFRTVIPRNVRLAEAPSFGKPVLLHDKESRGALSYLALAGEMIRREEEAAKPAAAAEHAVSPRTRRATTAQSEPGITSTHGDAARLLRASLSSRPMSQKKPTLGRSLAALLAEHRERATSAGRQRASTAQPQLVRAPRIPRSRRAMSSRDCR